MSLSLYKQKRSFNKTPEPEGGRSASKNELVFVVQKHDASRLHYDFRLEMEGVLKSWAVPKGPSLDPTEKRLAMMVEDHPFDYRTFEGIIPKGNYGAGTVMVWDEGTYEPLHDPSTSKKENEKKLLHELHAGSLKIVMHGKKLKGEFALVKIKNSEDNAWLLIKHRDKYATTDDVTKKDKSVVSKRSLEQIEKAGDRIWKSNRSSSNGKSTSKTPAKKVEKKKIRPEENEQISELLKKGKRAPFPHDVRPMLASLADEPFDDPEWLFEIKWDGYRGISYLNKGKVEIQSRKNLSFTQKFSAVADALKEWDIDAVIDGEIVAMTDDGIASFQRLQNYANNGSAAQLEYHVFDILWLNGKDLTCLPLIERKFILQKLVPGDSGIIRYSDHIEENGRDFFRLATAKGLEGIMAKRADSVYTTNFRTRQWLKLKNNKILEAIICGFTEGRKSRKYFGAVILGKYEGNKLIYIGHSGTGFTDKSLKELDKKLQPLVTDKMPFDKKPKTNMPVTWVQPKLVCEVKYGEITDEGILRHPVFMGLREDKEAKDEMNVEVVDADERNVSKGRPRSSTVRAETSKANSDAPKKPATKGAISINDKTEHKAAGNNKKKTTGKNDLLARGSKEELINIQGHEIKFTNLDKVYWPVEKITKRDMLNYYYQVMPYILPYMKDRPQSLNRHPNGINGPSFYQKNVGGKVADWITTYDYQSDSSGDKKFLVCSDEATLMYMASLGCIEMNPWHSRIQSPENPDWCVIDLDPDDNSFNQVIEAAQAVKKILDAIDVTSYPKTSGSTGMHIYIPLGAKYSYDQSRMLAEIIVNIVYHEIPSFSSLERNPSKRKGKIYLDFLQNRSIQTIAAPYSLRPKPGATVSTPLNWDEVKKGLTVKQFNIHTILDRLKNVGDIFEPVLGKGIDLLKTLKKVNSLR
ncbi:MAG TPA: DNA ligase D [Parafilimonas sp.]|nr:DNA ligase D [Parafilimonas sp.]